MKKLYRRSLLKLKCGGSGFSRLKRVTVREVCDNGGCGGGEGMRKDVMMVREMNAVVIVVHV